MNRNIAVILSARDAGLARQLGAAAGAIGAFEQSMNRAGSTASRMAAAGKFAFGAIGVAAAVGLGMAVNQAVQFERAMRNVNSISNLSEAQFRVMSERVVELSTRLPETATSLAEGLYEIASSGFQGAEGLHLLEVSSRAATAGMTDTETASRAILQVLNAYGLSARDAADVSDVLFSTVDVGIITFEELSTKLGRVIGAAAAAKVPIDDVGAAIAAMTLAGLNGAHSVTSLNSLIRKLINPSDALASLYERLGYESGEAALQQDGLYGVMERIRAVTGGSITDLMHLFPEIRAVRGAYALASADGMNYARTQAEISNETNRAGSTQDAFNEQMKALGNQFEVFRNQVTAVGIQVGAALIPALRGAMDWSRGAGSAMVDAFNSLSVAARPAVNAVGNALLELRNLFQSIGDAAGPMARALAKVFVGATIAGVTAFATALGTVASALADHPGLIRAVAVALTTLLIVRAVSAAMAAFSSSLIGVRVGLAALTAQAVAGAAVARVQALASAMTSFVMLRPAAAIGSLRTAFAGLGGAIMSPTAAVGAFVIGVTALQTAFDNADRHARDFISGLNTQFDTSSLDGLRGKTQELQAETRRLDEEWNNMVGTSNAVTAGIRGFGEVLSPWHANKVLDNARATNQYRDELENTQRALAMWEHDIAMIGHTLGISEEATRSWLGAIEDYDPTDTLTTTSQLSDQIRQMMAAASAGTPATDALSDALSETSDVTASATDRLEAFTSALDAMIGTMLGAFDAETAYAQGIQELSAALAENGGAMDAWTEAGQANREAFSGAVSAAIDYSKAIAETQGLESGANALLMFRQQIIDTMVSQGVARGEAENYVNSLGLIPSNVETLLALEGADTAQNQLDIMDATLDAVAQAQASPTVDLQSDDFFDDNQAIGAALAEIGRANPQATVSMDGEPFRATAEQVQLWAGMWEDSTWQAEALLNIIDPQNNFATLSEAAANWGSTSTSATAGVNDSASGEYNRFAALSQVWGGTHTNSTAGVNDRNSGEYNRFRASANAWGGTRTNSTAGVNDRNSGEYNRFRATAQAWGGRRDNATAGVNDHASGTLGRISGLLNAVDGRVARSTVELHYRVYGQAEANRFAALRNAQRMGGVVAGRSGLVTAQSGMLDAGIVQNPTVLFGERPTGGEAFIPRIGNRQRSLSILNQAADWYGADVVPQGMRASVGIGPMVQDFRTNVVVQVRATGGIDNRILADMIEERVERQLDKNTRRLQKELYTRGAR